MGYARHNILIFSTSTLTKSETGEPYESFEVVVKRERTEEEIKEEEKYEVNISEIEGEYETKSEYHVKVEYQQSMKY